MFGVKPQPLQRSECYRMFDVQRGLFEGSECLMSSLGRLRGQNA